MRHLVFSSVKQLLDHLVKSYHAPEKREETDENELVREKYETGKNEFVIEKLRNIVENELVKKKWGDVWKWIGNRKVRKFVKMNR